MVSILLSIIFGGWAVYLKLADLRTFSSTPLPLMTAIFFVIGVQFILMGLLAEMLMRNYYDHNNRQIYSIKDKINLD